MDNFELVNRIEKLEQALSDLNSEVYLNNFPAHQDFNKYVNFSVRLKVPHYATAPTKASVGEIIEVGGKLYIASATDTWALVGGQTA